MATLDQAIIRVIHKYEGAGDMRRAKRDVNEIEDGARQLNTALVAAGAAFATFAKSAVTSFGEIETAMAKFASRAGWSLNRFRRETAQSTHEIARLTGVQHALVIQATQEGISQGALAGMSTPEILRLVKSQAKLHAAGQTDIRQGVSAGIVARQYGAPSAKVGADWIYSASQVGAGNPADYANAFKDVAPGGSLLGIPITESLGALANIAAAAPSLEEGATWISALYKTLSMPMNDAQKMLQSRLGIDWKTELVPMVKEVGGLEKVLRMLRENFSGPELFEMFGRQEAVKGLEALTKIPGQLLRLQDAVRSNAASGPVDRAWRDNVKTWGINVQRLQRSLDTFLRSWGEPLAFVANRIVDVLRFLLDSLTSLNERLGGLPAVLASVAGGLVTVAASMNALQAVMSGWRALMDRGVGGFFGTGGMDDWDRRNRRNRNINTGVEAGVGVASAAGAAWWARSGIAKNVADIIKNPDADMWSKLHSEQFSFGNFNEGMRRGFYGAGRGGRGPFTGTGTDWVYGNPNAHQFFGFGMPNTGREHGMGGLNWRERMDGRMQGMMRRSYTGMDKVAKFFGDNKSVIIKGTGASLVGIISGGMIAAFEWWYKKTSSMTENRGAYMRAGLRPGVAAHLAGGGRLDEAPPFTRFDIQQSQIDRIRQMTAVAEERSQQQLADLIAGNIPAGNWFHRLIARSVELRQQGEFEEARQLEIARANRQRLWNKIFGLEDEVFDKQVEVLNRENNWWQSFLRNSFLNKLLGGILGEPDTSTGGIQLETMAMSPEWVKAHGGRVGAGLSEFTAQAVLDSHFPSLPTYDPRDNPNYDSRALLQHRLASNPNVNITINVENMNETTPEELADTIENRVSNIYNDWSKYNWDSVSQDADSPTY